MTVAMTDSQLTRYNNLGKIEGFPVLGEMGILWEPESEVWHFYVDEFEYRTPSDLEREAIAARILRAGSDCDYLDSGVCLTCIDGLIDSDETGGAIEVLLSALETHTPANLEVAKSSEAAEEGVGT